MISCFSSVFCKICNRIAFLHFSLIDDSVWAHLDIAGTAFDVPGIPYYKPGATGAGVRVLVELLKRRSI
jgi:leucyl aminopeptidase